MGLTQTAVVGGVEYVAATENDKYKVYEDDEEEGYLLDVKTTNSTSEAAMLRGYNTITEALAALSTEIMSSKDVQDGDVIMLPRPSGARLRVASFADDFSEVTLEIDSDGTGVDADAVFDTLMRYLPRFDNVKNPEGTWCYLYRLHRTLNNNDKIPMPRSVNTAEKEQAFYKRYSWVVRDTIRRLDDDVRHKHAGYFVVDCRCSECDKVHQRKLQDVFQSALCSDCAINARQKRKADAMVAKRKQQREIAAQQDAKPEQANGGKKEKVGKKATTERKKSSKPTKPAKQKSKKTKSRATE